MKLSRSVPLVLSACLTALSVLAQSPPDDRLEKLQRQLAEQSERLESLRAELSQQEEILASLREAVGEEVLDRQRGGSDLSGAAASLALVAQNPAQPPPASTQPVPNQPVPTQPVGEAPRRETRAPEVARIFAEPTALTRSGDFVLEPSLQSSYWASDRVALVGYTIDPGHPHRLGGRAPREDDQYGGRADRAHGHRQSLRDRSTRAPIYTPRWIR